ncbi:MAG TPA: thioredoxin domain-containing protein [Candidatus Paceibacterota bacterium]|nr:thioredoxin domain-containing protein [Candidatus Paceibacterota bacterium]HMO83182.1 thioredoxin domain-containing protein [Candidatus Paceibacterota bacterium]
MEPKTSNSSLAIPISIVLGFGLIAIAIYFSASGTTAPNNNQAAAVTAPPPANIRTVDSSDNIRGNPNAPILIVEYSDYDCPFCKRFHETMNQVMNEYGVGGKVAWVYRQLPIAQLHPNAPKISEAALCVSELAGNDAFWTFSDLVFGERGINDPTNMSRLAEFAGKAGADTSAFNSCLESGRMAARVNESANEAAAAGINGTPQSYIIVGNNQLPIEGAQPYAAVKQAIDNILGQLGS